MYEIIIFVYMRYFTTIFVLLLFACSLNKDDINNIDFFRFENQIFQTNGSNIVADRLEWEGEIGSFAFSYYNFLFNSNNDTVINNQILSFINNDDMREVYDTINLRFSSISNLKNDLGNSLYNFKNLFSEYPTPNIITMFSGFNYGVIVEDSLVAIGLDFYLGKNSIFYQRLGDPEYLRFQKQARFITPNILEAWYDSFFSFTNKQTNFLSELIYKGKIMYLISNTLENFYLQDQLRFSKTDLEWCYENESSIWAFLIDNDVLFSSREKEYRSYLNHAPFSKGMTQESPSRIAYYIGYKIVEKYMKNNNEVSIKELMFEEDFMKILTKSKYKP